jgi:hypothetical protein
MNAFTWRRSLHDDANGLSWRPLFEHLGKISCFFFSFRVSVVRESNRLEPEGKLVRVDVVEIVGLLSLDVVLEVVDGV